MLPNTKAVGAGLPSLKKRLQPAGKTERGKPGHGPVKGVVIPTIVVDRLSTRKRSVMLHGKLDHGRQLGVMDSWLGFSGSLGRRSFVLVRANV